MMNNLNLSKNTLGGFLRFEIKPYLSIIKIRFILLLQYRAAALAGICTHFLFGFVRVMVFEAFYNSSSIIQPLSYTQTITYIWLSQALLGLQPWNGDRELQSLIRSGNVAYELCRPLNLYNQWYSRSIALRSAPTLLEALPLFLITVFLLPEQYRLVLPDSSVLVICWMITTVGALLLSAAITNLINVSTIWTISGRGVERLLPALVMFFSGMIVPIPLFPDWLQRIVIHLPFSGLVDIPMRFFTGALTVQTLLPMLAIQFFWIVVLVIAGRWLTAKGLSKVIIQGG
ncbi:MAG: ABC transporter permease [Halanaerobiales bacterium]